jgi:hypothetical protein
MIIYFDLEAVPPNKEDPLVRHVVEKGDEDYRKLALHSSYAQILCIALVFEENREIVRREMLGYDRATRRFTLDQREILQSFWSLLSRFDVRYDLLVGFNILDYDLHLIATQSVIHQVRPSQEISFARFRSAPIYDLMWLYTLWRNRISMDEVARVLGLESSKNGGVCGATVYDHYLADNHAEVARYCLADVLLCREIYYRMKFMGCAAAAGVRPAPTCSEVETV